ncbi:MAG: alginate lyase family protein [Burkholderiales bacterium]
MTESGVFNLTEAVSGAGASLRWRINRLRCMTPAEIPHRLLRALSADAQSIGAFFGARTVPAAELAARPKRWIHADARVAAAPYTAAAERVAAGRLDVFALRDVDLGSPPRWNQDPKTGIAAPLGFGKLLDYRNPRLVGDIKYLWEPNRHLHLVTLAQAYALDGEHRHLRVIAQHIESWLDACPCGMGPNWSSALEVALRLINWAAAWQLIGGVGSPLFADAAGERLRRRWLDSVYQHAQFVRGYFSRHSSANNHLIGEAAGLFIAALTWPHWPRAARWRQTATAILEAEAQRQVAPDGVDREQAVSYQQFVLDLLLLCLLAGKKNGVWFSVAYETRIEAMLEFLASIMDVGGSVPMFGDADDGRVLGLAPDAGLCPYRSLLATGAIVFRSGEFKRKAGALDDKTRWLLGREADALFDAQSAAASRLPPRRSFPVGGYYILGCDFETRSEIRLIADAGPIGLKSIAAHGHADALSFTLSVGGLEFLIDPGTFAYHTQPAWRQYFRGTGAHNTVRIDGLDQSESGGNFMWLRKARAGCSRWSSEPLEDLFEGWQDGYQQLPDPVMHHRRIVLRKAARRVSIEDTLCMSAAHDIELRFHCSEGCTVEPAPGGYRLGQAGKSLLLSLPGLAAGSAQVLIGSVAPIGGWVSRRYDDKVPAPTIVWRARIEGDVVLRSEIAC